VLPFEFIDNLQKRLGPVFVFRPVGLDTVKFYLETDDTAAWLHVSLNLIRNLAKTATKKLSQLALVDATDASCVISRQDR
jgi:hypothetical protein